MALALMTLALAAIQPGESAPAVMVNMVPPAAIEGAPLRQPEGEGYVCAASYAHCLRIERGDDGSAAIGLFDMDAAAAAIDAVPLPLTISSDDDGASISLWDRAIRLPNPNARAGSVTVYLVGIVRTIRRGYSGGGGASERLHLFQLTIADGAAQLGPELVSMPLHASLMIRACFAEEDGERRRGACHDEYEYGAALTLDPADDRSGNLPALRYETQATAYPQTARRGEDSNAARPLEASDLSHWRDPECSYTRMLRFNPATERYEMDRPAPDCSSYTVP
jgi:hypothetical protein